MMLNMFGRTKNLFYLMTRWKFLLVSIYCAVFTVLSSCNNNGKVGNKSNPVHDTTDLNLDPTIAGSFSTQTVKKFDSLQLVDWYKKYDVGELQDDISDFYHTRDYAFAWFDEHGLTEQAEHLYNRVTNLYTNGYKDSAIYQDELTNLLEDVIEERHAIELDILLTAQYFHYSKRRFEGSVSEEQAKSLNWKIPRTRVNYLKYLQESLSNGQELFSNVPRRKEYAMLRNALQQLHVKGLDTGTAIEVGKDVYRRGDSSSVISTIKARLALWGDMKDSGDGMFNEVMEDGVKSFQQRNGLTQDGVAGPQFFKALNQTGEAIVKKILLNMERMKWMPAYSSDEHLLVNIPAYILYAYKGDSLLWDMDVIVGETMRRTVIFSDEISYMDFAPYWYVPPGILRRTVLPAIRRNSNYLVRNNMERVAGGGIRQRPGGSNPMGKVKFMFPNSHNIYLHDTPNKELFHTTRRTLSAGCVRVADAAFLAEWILKDDQQWTKERIKNAMNASREQRVHLKKKMPVYLAYFTAFADADGRLHFRPDVYGRDDRLARELFDSN